MAEDKAENGVKQPEEEVTYIYRMWITVKGKRIYRPNGRPFKIPIK